jgi:hypothetical protein
MVMMKYSRSDETQADMIAAIILYKAGYNPQAMSDFFKMLEAEGRTGPQFLSDHPNPGNREAAIKKEITGWPIRNYYSSSADFDKTRRHASGVKTYTAEEIAAGAKTGQWTSQNQKNGSVFNASNSATEPSPAAANKSASSVKLKDVLPSSKLKNSNLGPIKMARPENWDVLDLQGEGESLTIAPRAGIANNGFGYGLAIYRFSDVRKRATVDQTTAEIVKSIQSGGNDLAVIGKPTAIVVAGVRGRSVQMQSTSPFMDARGQSQKERDWLVTVPQADGSFVYFVFVAPESEFKYFQPTFEKMLKSVQF